MFYIIKIMDEVIFQGKQIKKQNDYEATLMLKDTKYPQVYIYDYI